MSVIDFATVQDKNGNFDIVLGNNLDFEYCQGFDTLFLYQIFVDRRGTKYDTAVARNRGGWAGDLMTKQSGYESGSLIWTKMQSRYTQTDLNLISAIAEHALQYFIDTGAAQQVKTSINSNTITGIIKIDSNTTNQFLALWNNIGNFGS
jgi:phage gp46-like protein